MKGLIMNILILECTDCGRVKLLDLGKSAEEIEEQIHDTISNEGWRYAYNREGFICESCRKNGSPDPFYELYAGKAKMLTKSKSYEKLLFRVAAHLETSRP